MRFLPLLTISVVVSVIPSAAQQHDATDQFEVRIPSEVRDKNVQLKYFLTGPFGGYGGTAQRTQGRFAIPTKVEGHSAEDLKAVIYIPGCRIVTLDVPFIRDSNRTADIICRELATIPFNGRVALPEDLAKRDYFVEVNYMAYWAHNFFGIADGMVTTFSLGRFTPDRDGVFHFRLPDFSKDQVTCSFKLDAGIQFIARERATLNILAQLVPSESPPSRWDMPIPKILPPLVTLRLHGKR